MPKSKLAVPYSPPTSPQRVGVYDLRTHWFEYLRRARNGEVFIITRRGKPVAQMEPISRDDPAKVTSGAAQQARDQRTDTPEEVQE